MDFFEQQELARRNSRWLVLWFLLAIAFAVASYCVAGALAYALLAKYIGSSPYPPWQLYAATVALVGGCMLVVSAYRLWQLSDGGHAVAYLLGAHYVDPGKCTPAERKLLNVVDEMAIASGIAVPPVYLMRHERAVNALVAGYSPNEAVIIVTRGTVENLSRDELQGVMGHEFSHILNGDMALNVRLVGILAGLTWIGEQGEAMVYSAAWQAKDVPREDRSPNAVGAVFGALIAFIGFPATLAADAIRAAISRQREFLADAASVQFTRNPDGIAGALDSILALRAHTTILAAHVGALSHMFFAPAVVHWWSFPSHPPLLERIRRAHPRFQRDDYRATRHGIRREVAVLDGAGGVVKYLKSEAAQVIASVGRPGAQHIDFGARLLASLPQRLRDALHRADEAEAALFALLAAPAGRGDSPKSAELRVYVENFARNHMLTLADLAVPAIKAQPQPARDRFLAALADLVAADRRVTLQEFVLLTFLRQRLREGAGQPIATRYRTIEEVSGDAHAVVSMVALAAKEGAGEAFEKGAAVLKLGWGAPLGAQALTLPKIDEALERLRHLAPFAKPGVLKACVAAAAADGSFRLGEAELVRMVAATLDCPMPPVISALDPALLRH